MKRAYNQKTFRKKTLDLISTIVNITDKYLDKGYMLTVRQVYYQLVAGGYIENNEKNYNSIKNIVNDGRMAGLIDWDAIEDRTRFSRSLNHWDNPKDIIRSASEQYKINKRADQPIYIEAWIEKDALIGIVEKVAKKWDIPCFSARGYPSVSALRDASARFIQEREREARVILYAGDHDPTGIDISRNIDETLRMFGANVDVVRIGLTKQQVNEVKAPANPAKETDKRFSNYVKKYGSQCWELDALPPESLTKLYQDYFLQYTDVEKFENACKKERQQQNKLLSVYQNWDYINNLFPV